MARKISDCNSRIRELLEITNLSQKEFSEVAHINGSNVSLYVNDKSVPKQKVFNAICKAFDVSSDWLMGYDVPMHCDELGNNPAKVKTANERICELLEIKHLTQADVCAKANIGKSSMSCYVSNKRVPKQRVVSDICNAFNISPAWLMGYDVPMSDTIDKEVDVIPDIDLQRKQKLHNLLTIAKSLDDRGIDTLIEVARSQEKYLY